MNNTLTDNQITEQTTGVTENENDNTIEITLEEHEPEECVTLGDTNIMSEKNLSNRQEAEKEEHELVQLKAKTGKKSTICIYTNQQSTSDVGIQDTCPYNADTAQNERRTKSLWKQMIQGHTQSIKTTTHRASTYEMEPRKMSQDERKNLRYLMFLKEKINGSIKA